MEKKQSSERPTFLIPFDIPLLKEVFKMEKEYMAGNLDYLYTKKYDTDTALKFGQAMYETSIEASKVDYINILVVFGIFSQICHNRYKLDVDFNDFWRMQKLVHEQSELYRDKFNGKKHNVGVT